MLPGITPSLLGNEVGNDSYTKLLLHFDDMSMMNAARGALMPSVVAPYNATLNTTTKKFGTSALYFQGGGASYMIVKNSSDFDFGAGDFTVDWWEYRVSGTDGASVFRRQSDNTAQGFLFGHYYLGRITFYMSSDGVNWNIANAVDFGAALLNQWVHFAVVRNGNTFYIFKNGIQFATWTSSLSVYPAPVGHTLCIGHWNGIGFHGYLDEIRISKGIARWTSNFTPPARAYGPDPDYSAWHTVRLYHFNNVTNAGGTVFPDSSLYATGNTAANGYGHPYTPFATGGSSYFNGGNFYNVLPGTEDLNFGGGDFTIDWWDWRSDDVAGRPAMVRSTVSFSYQPWLIGYQSGANLYCYCSGDSASWNILSTFNIGTFALNAWSHRAFVRKNGVFYGFKDGVLIGTNSGSAAPLPSRGNEQMFTGVWNPDGGVSQWGHGLMAELRISKGIARWTANFTRPTGPYT